MITRDGWFDFAERMPGPAEKVWDDKNMISGVVFHSAVGTLQGTIDVVFGPVANQRSVTGVIGYDGHLIQFYPVTASPWANGCHIANRLFLGFEHEGGEDTPYKVHEPLTDAQVETDVRICRDLAAYKGVALEFWRRPNDARDFSASLYEHREMVRFGSRPTACPSDRIRWTDILAGFFEPTIDGLGVRLDDGTDVGNVYTPPPGRKIAFVGAHWTDGTEGPLGPVSLPVEGRRMAGRVLE